MRRENTPHDAPAETFDGTKLDLGVKGGRRGGSGRGLGLRSVGDGGRLGLSIPRRVCTVSTILLAAVGLEGARR